MESATVHHVDGRRIAISDNPADPGYLAIDNDAIVTINGSKIAKPHLSNINNGDRIEYSLKNGTVCKLNILRDDENFVKAPVPHPVDDAPLVEDVSHGEDTPPVTHHTHHTHKRKRH